MKYIALLRGINVGGNNKVSMAQLKLTFESLGFDNVTTYINSGNVIFDAIDQGASSIIAACESAIEKEFGFHVVCSVLAAKDLKDAVTHAPSWWGADGNDKHNAFLLFLRQRRLQS